MSFDILNLFKATAGILLTFFQRYDFKIWFIGCSVKIKAEFWGFQFTGAEG